MIRTAVLMLSACLASGSVAAQVYDRRGYDPAIDDRYRAAREPGIEEARVIRVDPVFGTDRGYDRSGVQDRGAYPVAAADGYGDDRYAGDGYRSGYGADDAYAADRDGRFAGGPGSRCRTRRDGGYVDTGPYDGGDWRRDGDGAPTTTVGNETGRTVATVIGGVLGAVVGSQVGGGSGRFATSAIGTMVGGIAGREVYEAGQRNRMQDGLVTVCDPVSVDAVHDGAGAHQGGRGVDAYDVTYEYAGRQYTTRTRHHPGDTIRVRVDVVPVE